MKFGPVDVSAAGGSLLAHSLVCGDQRFRKGHKISDSDIGLIQGAGVEQVIVAKLDAEDVDENTAAAALANALDMFSVRAADASTGRVNLFAQDNGLFRVDAAAIDRLNEVDPAITIATLPDFNVVSVGDMVATIKIIPFAVPGDRLRQAMTASGNNILRVLPFKATRVGLVATILPSLKASVMDKTSRHLQARLDASESLIVRELRVSHDADAVASAIHSLMPGCDLIVVFGASAIVDPGDVIPAAISLTGGQVEHVGMPVDPGNLLVLGHLEGTAIIGAPGCARSPKENGFDWVLSRILAGEPPTSETIMKLGVGGLLKEIVSRPQLRITSEAAAVTSKSVDILVLAAGKASRMRGSEQHNPGSGAPPHKLLAEFDGVPLIRKSVCTALACGAGDTHVVIGFRAVDMRKTLDNLDVDVIENLDFDEGMASSLRAGISALQPNTAGVLILLADMPMIESSHLRNLINAFAKAGGTCVVRAVSGAVRGNPVILPRATFEAIASLEGDVGARQIIANCGLPVIDVDIGDAALLDVDTREAVLSAGGVLTG